jgi:hypothetical protein
MTINSTAYTLSSEAIKERLEALPRRRPRDAAKRFLDRLIDGPLGSEQILRTAATKGISPTTLRACQKRGWRHRPKRWPTERKRRKHLAMASTPTICPGEDAHLGRAWLPCRTEH